MSIVRTARIPTTSGSRYLQQLCKHWSHKFETQFDADGGWVDLPMGRVTLTAQADVLVVGLAIRDADQTETMQNVVASHLDRFAFREAPLPFVWQ